VSETPHGTTACLWINLPGGGCVTACSGPHPDLPDTPDRTHWVEVNGAPVRMPQGGVETYATRAEAIYAAKAKAAKLCGTWPTDAYHVGSVITGTYERSVAAAHMQLCHSDGSACEDGCDRTADPERLAAYEEGS